MNCPNCGTSNLDNATLCIHCGRPLSAASGTYTVPPAPPLDPSEPETTSSYTPPPPPPPSYAQGSYAPPPPGFGAGGYSGAPIPNYLVHSILVTLCCCLPLGIVAIVFAAQVNSKLAMGDIAGAQDASKKAKLFSLIGLCVGLVVIAIWVALNVAFVTDALNQANQ